MRKAFFTDRYGETIIINEKLAACDICAQLSLAVDELVADGDDIEAICGEEVADVFRAAIEDGDDDKARDIIDTTVFAIVDAMTFEEQVAAYRKVSYVRVTLDHIEDNESKPERPSAGIAELSAEDGFVKVEAKNSGENYHVISASEIRDNETGEPSFGAYRFTWPEGDFEVAGQSYEYSEAEIEAVSFSEDHEER